MQERCAKDVPLVSSNHMRLILVLILAMSRVMFGMMFERMSLRILDRMMMRLVVCWDMGWMGLVYGNTVLLEYLPVSLASHHGSRRVGAAVIGRRGRRKSATAVVTGSRW